MARAIAPPPDPPLGVTQETADVIAACLVGIADALGIRLVRTITGERLAYSPEEAAEALGLNEATIRNLVKAGDLHAVRMSRKILIPRASLDDFLAGSGPLRVPQRKAVS